jgi:long-chain-fatty-acid--coA ligase, putative
MLEQNGTLKIIDRKKNIFKLQQGEYIAPEKIENIYLRSQYVAGIFVYGDRLKSTLVGIVVPEFTKLKLWTQQHKIEGSKEDLCKNKVSVK